MIPAFLLAFFGGFSILGSAAVTAMRFWILHKHPDMLPEILDRGMSPPLVAGTFVAGILWIAAAATLWKCRWKTAAATGIFGILVYLAATWLHRGYLPG